jgi:hypothetical protein
MMRRVAVLLLVCVAARVAAAVVTDGERAFCDCCSHQLCAAIIVP